MSSIEGKPISTFTFGFKVSANAATSIMRSFPPPFHDYFYNQEEQTIMKTLKN